MKRQKIAVLLMGLGLFGCSNKQLYQGVMQNRQHACLQELPQQQEACMKRYETSYEEYERERLRTVSGEQSEP